MSAKKYPAEGKIMDCFSGKLANIKGQLRDRFIVFDFSKGMLKAVCLKAMNANDVLSKTPGAAASLTQQYPHYRFHHQYFMLFQGLSITQSTSTRNL